MESSYSPLMQGKCRPCLMYTKYTSFIYFSFRASSEICVMLQTASRKSLPGEISSYLDAGIGRNSEFIGTRFSMGFRLFLGGSLLLCYGY